ncbi:MAG: hypothetical protein Q4D60_04555 [Eubacteriales bacterium]|nr:hypothetical protein [Eubacteriales bacterium]
MKKRQKEEQTFVIKILDRRNKTWQGSIVWANENKERYFRSELEMLKMIDEVLTGRDVAVEEVGLKEKEKTGGDGDGE